VPQLGSVAAVQSWYIQGHHFAWLARFQTCHPGLLGLAALGLYGSWVGTLLSSFCPCEHRPTSSSSLSLSSSFRLRLLCRLRQQRRLPARPCLAFLILLRLRGPSTKKATDAAFAPIPRHTSLSLLPCPLCGLPLRPPSALSHTAAASSSSSSTLSTIKWSSNYRRLRLCLHFLLLLLHLLPLLLLLRLL